ncbi:MAG: hypoxanthine/guanine phosphoribosyltransferase [Thermoplasmata archaeon]|nr:hypoxanthine/guanine phosphoribosyltransferase [Thermoplasmata archaeon]
MELKLLKRSLQEARITRFGEYNYFVNPFTDGVPRLNPELIEEVRDAVIDTAEPDFDLIATPEAMGIHIATAVSLKTRKPFVIIRKKKYGLEGEGSLTQITGYSKSNMYVNDIKAGDRVFLLDNVISTGSTLTAIIKAIRAMGGIVTDAVVVVDKGEGRKKVEKECGIKIKTLVRVEVVDGRVIVV